VALSKHFCNLPLRPGLRHPPACRGTFLRQRRRPALGAGHRLWAGAGRAAAPSLPVEGSIAARRGRSDSLAVAEAD